MSCSRTQHVEACGDRTQDLSIRSLTLYHYATAPPKSKIFKNIHNFHDEKMLECIMFDKMLELHEYKVVQPESALNDLRRKIFFFFYFYIISYFVFIYQFVIYLFFYFILFFILFIFPVCFFFSSLFQRKIYIKTHCTCILHNKCILSRPSR